MSAHDPSGARRLCLALTVLLWTRLICSVADTSDITCDLEDYNIMGSP